MKMGAENDGGADRQNGKERTIRVYLDRPVSIGWAIKSILHVSMSIKETQA